MRRSVVLVAATLAAATIGTVPPASADAQTYQPTVDSLSKHPLPHWYNEAKFGIFIHWGPTAVPAYDDWYWYAMNQVGGAAWLYHKQTYGEDFNYDDFIPRFTADKYDPKAWVRLFQDAGARYFVLTSKHHDGYALAPSAYSDRNSVALPPHRDLVGELFDASRLYTPSLHPGLYYSLPEFYNPSYHWTGAFAGGPPHNPFTGAEVPYTGYKPVADYVEDFQKPQMEEFIDRYNPDVLWCDIGGPNDSLPVIAHLYNRNPQAVVDNRCGVPVHDFTTPEQTVLGDISPAKWETADIINSWFYMTDDHLPPVCCGYKHQTAKSVIDELTDIVSKNGNLLLDISPKADGTIPENQVDLLQGVGAWLRINGGAIYGASYWTQFQDTTANVPVRYTVKDNALYVTALEWPGPELSLDAAPIPISSDTQVRLLGATAQALQWHKTDTGRLVVEMPAQGAAATRSQDAYTFEITTPGMSYVRTALAQSEVTAGHPTPVKLQVTNLAGHPASGSVTLDAPTGLTLAPARFDVSHIGPRETVTLQTTASSASPGTYPVRITTDLGGRAQTVTDQVKVVLPNIAVGKPATQSSTDFGGTPDRAVDGNTDGSFPDGSVSHTAFEASPWWQVDLGDSHQIDSIDVWNRTDCCADRLSDYYVLVSDQPFASGSLADALAQPGVWSVHETGQAGRPTSMPVGRSGRYVRVQLAGSNWLHIAEVQVRARE